MRLHVVPVRNRAVLGNRLAQALVRFGLLSRLVTAARVRRISNSVIFSEKRRDFSSRHGNAERPRKQIPSGEAAFLPLGKIRSQENFGERAKLPVRKDLRSRRSRETA